MADTIVKDASLAPVTIAVGAEQGGKVETQTDNLTSVLLEQPKQPKVLLADKYETKEALIQGINSGHSLLKIDPVDESSFKDVNVAVTHYKLLQKLIGSGEAKRLAAEAQAAAVGDAVQAGAGAADAPLKIGVQEAKKAEAAQVAADPQTVMDVLSSAGLDPAALEKQWTEKKTLDKSHYDAIGKVIDPEGKMNAAAKKLLIDQSARGLVAERTLGRAEVEKARSDAYVIAGGKEAFDRLLSEARTFTPEGEVDDVNARLNSTKHLAGATRQLLQMRSEYLKTNKSAAIGTEAGGNVSPGKVTLGDFKKLSDAADRGDKSALAQLAEIGKSGAYAQWFGS